MASQPPLLCSVLCLSVSLFATGFVIGLSDSPSWLLHYRIQSSHCRRYICLPAPRCHTDSFSQSSSIIIQVCYFSAMPQRHSIRSLSLFYSVMRCSATAPSSFGCGSIFAWPRHVYCSAVVSLYLFVARSWLYFLIARAPSSFPRFTLVARPRPWPSTTTSTLK